MTAVAERTASPVPAGDAEPRPWVAYTVLGCIALSILSVFVLPSTPSYDPWAWIVWGREAAAGSFTSLAIGGPSWKPLPVAFTTIFSVFGGAAPKLWLIAARAGGLLALLGAWRLASRFGGWLAGLLAAAALVLTQESVGLTPDALPITQDWVHYLFRGASEPMLVACALWAIERHLAGRRGSAFVLGVATGLIRPEAWPFLALYAVWLWRTEVALRGLVVGGLALLPLMWFVPPWIGSGHPFAASTQAQDYNGHLGSDPALEVLRRGADLVIIPVLVAALAAVVVAWRRREMVILWLAGGAIAWVVLVDVMAIAGYPGLGRFMFPAAGVACVLAGIGVVGVAGVAGRRPIYWAVVVVAIGASVPFAIKRVSGLVKEKSQADQAVSVTDQMNDAVRVAGGRRAILPCSRSVTAINHTMQTALAWTLHVPLTSVRTVLRHPGVNFVGPHLVTIDGAAAPVEVRPRAVTEVVARAGVWQVVRVLRPGSSTRCVGR